MLLSEARARVYNYLDDDGTGTTDGTRWSLTEVDQKLELALNLICGEYAAKGGNRLTQMISVTSDSSGVASLSSYAPVSVQNVQMNLGSTFINLPIVTQQDFFQPVNQARPLRVLLVATPTFPTLSSSSITYGNSESWKTFDELIVMKAVRLLAVKDRETIQALETQHNELLNSILSNEFQVKAFSLPAPKVNALIHPYCVMLVGNSLYIGQKAQSGN